MFYLFAVWRIRSKSFVEKLLGLEWSTKAQRPWNLLITVLSSYEFEDPEVR